MNQQNEPRIVTERHHAIAALWAATNAFRDCFARRDVDPAAAIRAWSEMKGWEDTHADVELRWRAAHAPAWYTAA